MTTDYSQRLSVYQKAKELARPTNDLASTQLRELELLYAVKALCPDGVSAFDCFDS